MWPTRTLANSFIHTTSRELNTFPLQEKYKSCHLKPIITNHEELIRFHETFLYPNIQEETTEKPAKFDITLMP
ncbi:hypothetical protein DSO57_1018788 [Entomophthora muscae]|uniref:Uncharacterized protein n=1 Tax=Entomophthora muscae TaxID=34485 RepID=A0ACC2SH54_9FUNG|nr:hypothetical protein DSO57_1018788 [Entomophthora muscae]